MVIRLSPAIQKRVERAAKAEGVTLSKWLEAAVKERLVAKRKPHEVSEARRRLNALLKNQKPPDDFMEKLHRARRYARQLEEDNADWIESVTQRIRSAKQSQNP